jgi:hypothetical protein
MLYKDLYINIVTTVDSGSPPPLYINTIALQFNIF